jgi:hypothetical protein
MKWLPYPTKHDYADRTVYTSSLLRTIDAWCGGVFAPRSLAVKVNGTWIKATKEAKEEVAVKVGSLVVGGMPGRYLAITSQHCSSNPWSTFNAHCDGYLWLQEQQVSEGWQYTPFAGIDYRGPYPAMRLKIFKNRFYCGFAGWCWPYWHDPPY